MTRASRAPARRLLALLAATLLAGTGLTATAAPASADPAPRRIVSGWLRPQYMTQALAAVKSNPDLWSDASPFWHRATGATAISGTGDPAVVTTLRSYGIPVLPTVTESLDTPQMETLLADPTSRAAHVQALVDLVTSKGYDGIDLDYESMNYGGTSTQKAHLAGLFVTFLGQLNTALDARGKLLSAAVGARTSGSDPSWAVHDYAGIGRSVDRLRIMAYDKHWRGGSAGAVAPLPWTEQVVAYAVTVVAPAKIQLGVPLYGYDWPRNADGSWGTATSLSTYAQAEALRTSVGATRRWSDTDAAPYFAYARDGVAHEVWYDDAESTRAKMTLVGKYGLKGLAFWHVAEEDPRQWPILRSYATQQATALSATAPAQVTYGSTVAVSGRLTSTSGAAVAGARVDLQRRIAGETTWSTVRSGTTSSTGAASFSYAPKVNGQFRLSAPQTWTYAEATSAAVTTSVRWRVTAAFDDSSVARGTTARLRGSVLPARAGTRVVRQRYVGGSWVDVASTTAQADGRYAFSFTWTYRGSYTYRVRAAGTTLNATGDSPSRTLTVS